MFDPKKTNSGKCPADLKNKASGRCSCSTRGLHLRLPHRVGRRGRPVRRAPAAGAEVVSVSTDTKFVHLAWQREEKLLKDVKYLMGADATGKVSRLFGV